MCSGGNDGGCADLSICLFQSFFFFLGQEQSFPLSVQSKKVTLTGWNIHWTTRQCVRGSVLRAYCIKQWVRRVRFFKEQRKGTPNCSEASSAASSQILHKAPSSPASCRGGELAGLSWASIMGQAPAPWTHLKDTQPTRLLQNQGDGEAGQWGRNQQGNKG